MLMSWSTSPVIIGLSSEAKRESADPACTTAETSGELDSRAPVAQSDQLKLVRGRLAMGHRRCLQEGIRRRWI